ncbi:hypothetical protein SCATT_06200 [Streptantibioticus cattleyicolor NRRL 8057 = DSM 46488]|uniref:Uncharacterized protein n=1 Tax=Streptantibioticus cattleyicolor (strain ATCC 35852 / DSM 46488 / JCM 4925 / NBRC 14057 / NRRL 8057) TaxID=1003195 RepID=F8JT51_STREN|nr:hypothetical protein SCATT_06200 [Streptantibioticus cattleyicolor NRRL 8057 = DSM 46488]MYS57730.1 hypothetical protein [Streptomyces sp. SID5468]CCB73349.1 protein of unknown function [Streptantibioticus cattleyicolor NRRL 8057 = DSM 46488]
MTIRHPPTVAQLLNLADRAERRGLTAAEAARLRAGLRDLASEQAAAVATVAELRNANGRLRTRLRRKAAPRRPPGRPTMPTNPGKDTDAAVRRATELGYHWLHIPAKRAAGAAVLAALTNNESPPGDLPEPIPGRHQRH